MRLGGLLGSTGSTLPAVLLLAVAPSAHGGTFYVANNGIDSDICGVTVIGGVNCGAESSPCRSISCGIREASPGDTIIVGPGRYGDLNRDGDLGDGGDEFGSAGCDCMISVSEAVAIVSSHGAAATLIDAESVNLLQTVRLTSNVAEFGRPGKGFMVTGTAGGTTLGSNRGHAIVVNGATNVQIRGNQTSHLGVISREGYGIWVVDDGPGTVLIEGNQVIGLWEEGIAVRGSGSRTVRRNHVSSARFHCIIFYQGGQGSISGNLVTGCETGIYAQDSPLVPAITGNAVHGNHFGIEVFDFDGGLVQKNNVFGNVGACGLDISNSPFGATVATNNYWGSSTGPGADPADDVCDDLETSTTVPFATKPFKIDPPLRP